MTHANAQSGVYVLNYPDGTYMDNGVRRATADKARDMLKTLFEILGQHGQVGIALPIGWRLKHLPSSPSPTVVASRRRWAAFKPKAV